MRNCAGRETLSVSRRMEWMEVAKMAQKHQADARGGRKRGTPGPVSRWMQRKMNARMNRKVRGGRGNFMGMEVLILNTVGRRSGQPRETPVAWFAGDERGWLIVASGGGSQHPDWYVNLMAHPDRASIELPGRDAVGVTPHRLHGTDREHAWQRITAAQPRYAKYQSKSDREYPVVRLTPTVTA
jgi:deazaflavin-dependent oxidoreductase (nitroreductase family)